MIEREIRQSRPIKKLITESGKDIVREIMNRFFSVLVSIVLLLVSLSYQTVIPGGEAAAGNEVTIISCEELHISPGESRCLLYNSTSSTFGVMPMPDVCAGLPGSVSGAIMKVPLWLRHDLSNKFAELCEGKLNVGSRSAPAFADLDGDGDQDMTVGILHRLLIWPSPQKR